MPITIKKSGSKKSRKGKSKLPEYWDVCYSCFRVTEITKEQDDKMMRAGGGIVIVCKKCDDAGFDVLADAVGRALRCP
jgi:hypothetical protein